MPLHEMQLRPEFDPTPHFNPRSVTVPIARVAGVTWTVLSPGRPSGGGMFLTGQGSAVTLDGRFDAALAGSRSLFVDLGSDAMGAAGGSRAAQFMLLDQAVREARSPESRIGEQSCCIRPGAKHFGAISRVAASCSKWIALSTSVRRSRSLSANGMKPVIAGGAEAWVVANELARARRAGAARSAG